MGKHAYIKMIESNVMPSSNLNPDWSKITTFDRDGTDVDAWVSGTDVLPGRHETDDVHDSMPGGYIDDGTEDHIFDENRPYDGDDS